MTPDFDRIRAVCNGMMRPEVYKAIYQHALKAKPGDMVEVGTAHAASTVCLALAIKNAGREGRVFTFDRHAAGSRSKYGDAAANVRIARDNLKTFGVDDIVEIVIGDVAEGHIACQSRNLSLLMIDADGQVDRDMRLFGDRLLEQAPVIIDDFALRGRARDLKTHLRIDQKHRITYHLTELFEDAGVIEKTHQVNETWFGIRGRQSVKAASWPSIVEAYRHLIFSDVKRV
jgi:predicted O-methyltransferase YrrM